MTTLIISTERHFLARAFDWLITLLAWGVFFYLCARGLQSWLQADTPPMTSLSHLGNYLLVAGINALLLMGWAYYNKRRFLQAARRSLFPSLQDAELVSANEITTTDQIDALQQARLMYVSHDAQGRLVRLRSADVDAVAA